MTEKQLKFFKAKKSVKAGEVKAGAVKPVEAPPEKVSLESMLKERDELIVSCRKLINSLTEENKQLRTENWELRNSDGRINAAEAMLKEGRL